MTKFRSFSAMLILLIFASFSLATSAQETPTNDDVTAIAWSLDGHWLAVGHNNGSIDILNSETGQTVTTFTKHVDRVIDLAWSPDGLFLASSSEDDTLRIWRIADGRYVRISIAEEDSILSLVWVPANNQLIGGSVGITSNLTLKFWNPSTGQLLRGFSTLGSITHLVLSPDGAWLGYTSYSGRIAIMDLASTITIADGGYSTRSASAVWAAAWSPDGTKVVTGHQSGAVRIWDVTEARTNTTLPLLFDLQGNDSQSDDFDVGTVRALAFSTDGSTLFSISANGWVRSWDVATGQVILNAQAIAPVYAAAWSPDSTQLAYGGVGSTVQIAPMPQGATETPNSTGEGQS